MLETPTHWVSLDLYDCNAFKICQSLQSVLTYQVSKVPLLPTLSAEVEYFSASIAARVLSYNLVSKL